MDEGTTIEPTDYEFALAEMLGYPDIPHYERVTVGDMTRLERHGKIVTTYWTHGEPSDDMPFDTIDDAHNFVTSHCRGFEKSGHEYERTFRDIKGNPA